MSGKTSSSEKSFSEAAANAVAGVIIAIGQLVYSVFKMVFGILSALA